VHRPGVRGLNVGGGGEHTNCRKKALLALTKVVGRIPGNGSWARATSLAADVYDGDGADLGKVHDLRFEADGASGV